MSTTNIDRQPGRASGNLSDLVAIQNVPRVLPRTSTGRKVSFRSVYRWIHPGIAGVKLRVLTLGGTMYTCPRWLEEFGERVAAAQDRRRNKANSRRRKATAGANP